MNASSRHILLAGMGLVLLAAGCTTNYYRKSADKEVYGIVESKTPAVPNMDTNFTIEATNVLALEGLPQCPKVAEFLGQYGQRELGASILTLEDALRVAVHSSRAYQSRKEQLYLSTLSLTLVRHQFTPLFNASANGAYGGQTEQALTLGVDEVTGQPKVIVSDNLVEQRRVNAGANLGVNWLIRDVGRITAAMSADFLRFVTGDPRATTSSQVGATFLRPLWRDAGFKTETEALTQAERSLLYDLRDFTLYRKEFSVQVAAAYYAVLGNRDAVRNAYENLGTARRNADRSRALALEGREKQAALGRLEQEDLTSQSVWINAVKDYQQGLDNFKILLGLSVDTAIVLDDRELEKLTILDPNLSVDDSIKVALAARLDFLNSKEQLEDATRKVDLAANLLKPRVDLTANVVARSNPNDNTGLPLPQVDRYAWSAGLNVDPGLDRVAERNAYRTALINRNQAERQITQKEDEIKLQVRDSWRTLEQAKRNYEISEISVKLAERRVEEQTLLAELGRANAQDQVDTQNSLILSRNQRTQAVVTHTISRLNFWRNLGILYIKDNGQWEEIKNANRQ
jgi:outer membrane protein TolC